MKSRPDKHPKSIPPGPAPAWPVRLRRALAVMAVGLPVATTLVPSEGAIHDGAFAGLATGWCLLLVLWGALALHTPGTRVQFGWTEIAGAMFVVWHSVAALAWLGHRNDRQSLNALWLVVGYGLTVFVLRQVIRSARQARILVAVMIWLATTLAFAGYVQYFVTMPALRAEFSANPERVLIERGISTDPNSAERIGYENRIQSVEPLATFALTNSLAGFLAPWLIAALAIGLAVLRDGRQQRTLVGAALLAALLAGCLLLTKSRTAVLAVLAGFVLLALYGRQSGWRIDWRIPTIAAAAIVLIGLGVVYVGGLDAEVLSEAPKSVLYRLEYWRSTAALIADHPLLGCGPGNFQEAYAAYKLPQASEMVADPHNFLLEIWATAGTPALLLLLATAMAFIVDLVRAARGISISPRAPHQDADFQQPKDATLFFGGGIAGLLIGAMLAWLGGFPLDRLGDVALPTVWWLGFPLLPLVWWLLHPWIIEGELPIGATIVALLTLFINLLAAGALVFPGVMVTALVLVPVTLRIGSTPATGQDESFAGPRARGFTTAPWELAFSQAAAGILCALALALTGLCVWTQYHAVVTSRLQMQIATTQLQKGDAAAAEKNAIVAAHADPWWPEPWRMVAELRFRRFLSEPQEAEWGAFVAAASEFQTRNPRHHGQFFQRGNWFLLSWQRHRQEAALSQALDAYRAAVAHYPNHALYHAQLAWALHLAGQDAAAQQSADKAKALDDAMPHADQKLARRRITDLQRSPEQFQMFRPESAEQTVASLRTRLRR